MGSACDTTDVVKAFTDACREEGIEPALYFSMLDIKHKITSSSCTANDIEFIKAQLTELLTNYGEIPFIIFDAWNAYWGGPNYTLLPYEEIVNLVHTLQPSCLVINISCEANNVRSEVAMFESAAGQNVPDWFENVNISCNTPTSHWFWCTKYRTETFKTADWVLKDNLDAFRDSDTVFILNVSPNQQGVLINKYRSLLEDIGEVYRKQADVTALPDNYLADYDYHNNLLFHKNVVASSQDSNASGDRAVDGYADYSFSHETASKTSSGISYWFGDIGYMAKLGELKVHISSDMQTGDIAKLYVYLLEDYPGRPSVTRLDRTDYIAKYALSEATVEKNCYTLDLEGKEARYVVVVSDSSAVLSFSEIVATPYGCQDASAYSLREKFSTVSYTMGSELLLPSEGVFVTADGGLVTEAIVWETADADLSHTGKIKVFGKSESGCAVSVSVNIISAGIYTEVQATGVTASSMWSMAESLGWAHSRNLIDKSGLTLNGTNLLYSTHDNPYNGTSMWHTLEGQRTGWLIFDFGKTVDVTNALIWNHNQLNEADRSVKTMKVYYTDKANPQNADWILVDTYTLTKAGAVAEQRATDLIAFGTVSARKIKFEILDNYGDDSVTGLSEVIFLKEKTSSSLDLTALNASISEFEMCSIFDYDAAAYAAAKAVYEEALTLLEGATQSAVDACASLLSAKLDTMKATYRSKTPILSEIFRITLDVGETLPATLSVSFVGGGKSDAAVSWNAIPNGKLETPGFFVVSGTLTGSPHTVSAFVSVEGISSEGLSALVDAYKTLSTEQYTEESINAFTKALQAAEALLADKNATQAEIDSVKAALSAAKYALAIDYAKADNDTAPDTTDTLTTDQIPDTSVGEPLNTTPDTTPDTTPEPPAGGKDKNGVGTVIALILGGVALVAIGGAIVCFLMKKKMKG